MTTSKHFKNFADGRRVDFTVDEDGVAYGPLWWYVNLVVERWFGVVDLVLISMLLSGIVRKIVCCG